jgi:hypothetical protein
MGTTSGIIILVVPKTTHSGGDSERGGDTDEGRRSGTHPKRGIVDVVTEVGNNLTKRKHRHSRPVEKDPERELDEASGA